jgi:hypothetical protein
MVKIACSTSSTNWKKIYTFECCATSKSSRRICPWANKGILDGADCCKLDSKSSAYPIILLNSVKKSANTRAHCLSQSMRLCMMLLTTTHAFSFAYYAEILKTELWILLTSNWITKC